MIPIVNTGLIGKGGPRHKTISLLNQSNRAAMARKMIGQIHSKKSAADYKNLCHNNS